MHGCKCCHLFGIIDFAKHSLYGCQVLQQGLLRQLGNRQLQCKMLYTSVWLQGSQQGYRWCYIPAQCTQLLDVGVDGSQVTVIHGLIALCLPGAACQLCHALFPCCLVNPSCHPNEHDAQLLTLHDATQPAQVHSPALAHNTPGQTNMLPRQRAQYTMQ